jgi:molybdopterin-containing oxidoreductase family membrane subunit
MTPTAAPPTARRFWAVFALGALVVLAGIVAAHVMETHGHIVTGMNNRIVWGLPHVFAIFLIVAASGVLNVASVGSVFRQAAYKPQAPLSGLLCLALLAGGLAVLSLDLGRPERIVVAATHYNFTSVFAWNMFLYTGMAAIVAVYLWVLMERRFNRWSRPVGIAAFAWRIILTSGTGSIFAFLVARQAYGTAILVPLFLAMSFAWGLAVFLLAQSALAAWIGRATPIPIRRRMGQLLALFIATVLLLVAAHHLTNLYFAKQVAFERFLLVEGGIYPQLFWWGYVVAGSVVPLVLLWHPRFATAGYTLAAAALTVAGAFALLYVFIIGGQAFPLEMFPGYAVTSSFADGRIAGYAPSLPEVVLGIGGVGIAFLIALIGARVLDFAPRDDAATAYGAH